jgi:hypothetical protein
MMTVEALGIRGPMIRGLEGSDSRDEEGPRDRGFEVRGIGFEVRGIGGFDRG